MSPVAGDHSLPYITPQGSGFLGPKTGNIQNSFSEASNRAFFGYPDLCAAKKTAVEASVRGLR
jgi:hypothetical protein